MKACLPLPDRKNKRATGGGLLPRDLLSTISNRFINEVKGINRVVYDISSKPPDNIEWG